VLWFDLGKSKPALIVRRVALEAGSHFAHCGGSSVISGSRSRFGPPDRNLAELKLLTDDQLMVQLQAGVNDALAVLFERYHRLVFSIALKIVRDRSEAEDVTQNVFLEIYSSVAQFDPGKGTLKVWLLQYAYHRAFNWKGYLNRRNFYHQEGIEELDPFYDEFFTAGRYAPGELQRLLQQGLASLGAPQKRVIELANYEGLSMKEIANKTGDSLSNVRHHYYRGLQKLRSFITQPRVPVKRLADE
jgi:RNA polymerase sigma-70 factor, ECF subfamily